MAHPVILPRQGQSVESCIITQWFKKEGEAVREGEALFSYETDKASFEETAKAEGVLLAILFAEDEDVPVLSTVAVIGAPGEDISEYTKGSAPAAPAAVEPAPQPQTVQAPVAPAASVVTTAPQGVSPRARMTAQRLAVDVSTATPTGPAGRVIERDIFTAAQHKGEAAPAAAPLAAPTAPSDTAYTEVKLSKVRRLIAEGMQRSLQGMAQLTHHSSCDATHLLALRARFKGSAPELGLSGITLNDLVLFAVSRVLPRHPDLNAHLVNDSLRQFAKVNLGMAVDSPRGLLVPTLFNAGGKNLRELSQAAKELSAAAQSGAINPDLLTGGTFTVSNLGALGVESFTPIINPPQTAILGVCAITQRVRVTNGVLSAYPALGLSLTYDHRAVDGAPASRFLQDLVSALEQIDLLILE